MGVIESVVARYFSSDEIGLFVEFIRCRQFHFGHDEPFVVAIELINFEGMLSRRHEIASLVDDARLTEMEQMFGLFECDFLLELIAREASVERWSLDGEKSTVVAEPHSYGASATTTDVALFDATMADGLLLIAIAANEELPFNLQSTHIN